MRRTFCAPGKGDFREGQGVAETRRGWSDNFYPGVRASPQSVTFAFPRC